MSNVCLYVVLVFLSWILTVFPLKLNSPNLLCVFNCHRFAGLYIITCMRSLLGNQTLNILSHRCVRME